MCGLTEQTPYIAELRAMRARVEESLAWLDTLSTVTRSGQVNPPPADAAVRGELLQELSNA